MKRSLSSHSTLETLKKEAKRWLKALRAGDALASQRLFDATGVATVTPGLRDVQLALAREHGRSGWAALRHALDDLVLARHSLAERVDIVLNSLSFKGDPNAAKRILARWPEIGSHNLYTAVATGNLAEVERHLVADPAAATRKGGPLQWEPLLYLAYTRLPGHDKDALEIARALLDQGADPNARLMDDWDNPFTVLTGVIGQGEGDKAPHPQAIALATLLIERGAHAFDTQALYNTSITRDDTTWLEILWTASERQAKLSCWKEIPEKSGLGGIVPMNALNYLLGNAVACNHLRRAAWLLTHGADANSVHAYSKRLLREEALSYGNVNMADLLVQQGAAATPLEGQVAFQAACMRLDRDAAHVLATRHPEYLRDASPMLNAARTGRADVVSLLLELGMDADVADATQQRALHHAAGNGAIEVAKLLIAHGADIDRPTTTPYGGGAMGFAAHFGQREMAALLAPLSQDVANLVYLGMADRLRELFAADPTLANRADSKFGVRPLFALPDDEDDALEMTALLLAHNADPSIKDNDGLTAEQVARNRGLIDAADLMKHG
jgi:ankyrin repeat protein